jgi:hypothetical protein
MQMTDFKLECEAVVFNTEAVSLGEETPPADFRKQPCDACRGLLRAIEMLERELLTHMGTPHS